MAGPFVPLRTRAHHLGLLARLCGDLMTCVERLAEIEARATDAASATPAYRELELGAIVEQDVPWLVEQVRIRDAAIAAVLDLAERWIFKGAGDPDNMPDEIDYIYDGVAVFIRDAIASALDVTL